MKKENTSNKRFHVYLLILAGLSLLLLIAQLGNLFGSASREDEAEHLETDMTVAVKEILPFIWSRHVWAGEKISPDMFLLKASLADDSNTEESMLRISGRYLLADRSAGESLNAGDWSEGLPLSPEPGFQALWLALKADAASQFENIRLGSHVMPYAQNNSLFEANQPPVALLSEPVRVLALDREALRLCLELSEADYLLLLQAAAEGALQFVPGLSQSAPVDSNGGEEATEIASGTAPETSAANTPRATSETNAANVPSTAATTAATTTMLTGTTVESIEKESTSSSAIVGE